MTLNAPNPERGGDSGFGGCSLLASENSSEHCIPATAVQTAKAALIRELLGVSLAIGIESAAKSLRHVIVADDREVLGALREFLAAADTATECAKELRDLVEVAGS